MLLEIIGLGLTAGQEIGRTNRARIEGRRQSGFLGDALKDLGLAEKSLRESLGSSLALPTLQAERSLESVSDASERKLEEIGKRQDQVSQSTGFANIPIDNNQIKNIRKEFDTRREDIDIALAKSLSGILSEFEQQKFGLKSQRQQLEMQKKMAQQQSGTKYFGIF